MIQRQKEGKRKWQIKRQFDQNLNKNAVNYCLTHPELSRKECAKNLGLGIVLYKWKKKLKNKTAFI